MLSTLVSPAFEAIFLFELCNEAWTFEVAKMSSSLAKEKAKKVITQFIRPSLQYLPAAKTFVKTLKAAEILRALSQKCLSAPQSALIRSKADAEAVGEEFTEPTTEKLALVLSRLPTAIYPEKKKVHNYYPTQEVADFSCGHKLCLLFGNTFSFV